MSKPFWDLLKAVRDDFSDHSDVKGLYVRSLSDGRSTVRVTVRNADGKYVVWELVDDGVSSDRWKRVSVEVAPVDAR